MHFYSVLQLGSARCSSVLQSVAACYSVLLQCVTCCSVLQSVVQRVAVCCSVLQRVAVCCVMLPSSMRMRFCRVPQVGSARCSSV